MTNLGYIRTTLSAEALRLQLVEELAELAQAALKMIRAIDNGNPCRKSLEQCRADVQEEIWDVMIVLKALGLKYSKVSASSGGVLNAMARDEKFVLADIARVAMSTGEYVLVNRDYLGSGIRCIRVYATALGFNADFQPDSPKLERWAKSIREVTKESD